MRALRQTHLSTTGDAVPKEMDEIVAKYAVRFRKEIQQFQKDMTIRFGIMLLACACFILFALKLLF